MKTFVFLAAFLALLAFGQALSCYKCNGCETASILKETCRNFDPKEEQVTACLTQKLRTHGTADPMSIKKCVVYNKKNIFDCPSLPSGDTIQCQICDSDYCNSAPKLTNMVAFLCLGLVFVLPNVFY